MSSWILFALLSAAAAGATAILAKIGVQGVSSNLATAVRTAIVLVFAWGIVVARGEVAGLRELKGRTLVFLLLSGIAYFILQNCIIAEQGRDSKLAASLGKDWKGKLSPVLYAIAIGLSFSLPWIAASIYVGVALMWLIPDQRVARVIQE